MSINKKISGWGRARVVDCEVWSPNTIDKVESIVQLNGNGLIARGCGRSYGDQSTNCSGTVIDMTGCDGIESFDEPSGVIVVKAGVTLRYLVEKYLDKGIVPPVCPGTGFVTVGGAVANDVHGKNHVTQGSFSDHIIWIDLLLASGEIRRISNSEHQELYLATIGGIGLTGIIVRVAFKMRKIATNAVNVQEKQYEDLESFMEALRKTSDDSTYSVGWVDGVATGSKLGRGILMTAEYANGFIEVPKRRSINVPFNFPNWALNKYTVRAFNTLYHNRFGKSRAHHMDFEKFVFPLDMLLNWNRMYGNRGFFQFQCVIPFENSEAIIRRLLEMISESGLASPLAVLKAFGQGNNGYLSFPMQGFTLAIDFPISAASRQLIGNMYEITAESGGRVYLAKDQLLTASLFRRMYSNIDRYQEILSEVDPNNVFQSDTSRRLGIKSK